MNFFNNFKDIKKDFCFQVHVTTEPLQNNVKKYIDLCKEKNVKPVLIELEQGDFVKQPMYTQKVVAKDLNGVFKNIKDIKEFFEQNGFKTVRTKIEIDLKDVFEYFGIDKSKANDKNYIEEFSDLIKDAYIETHFRIFYYNKDYDLNIIKKISYAYGFYVSKNDIDTNRRFVTFRKDLKEALVQTDGSLDFIDYEDFEIAIGAFGLRIGKKIYECCVYDSNKMLDKNWKYQMQEIDVELDDITDISYIERINLEIREELMIYIANNLPFVVKGSFLTSSLHKNPYKRLKSGGDIDLIYKNRHVKKYNICDYESYHNYIREIEKELKNEFVEIFYKLEEIIIRKLNLSIRPPFIKEFEEYSFDKVFSDSDAFYLYMVNYGETDDFTTICLEIMPMYEFFDDIRLENLSKISDIAIDIAIDMPINFEPQKILYKKIDGTQQYIENTTPLLYQIAWKLHQVIVRPRIKDLDDIATFLKHIDFNENDNLENLLDEIIKECSLLEDKDCQRLLVRLKNLFLFNYDIKNEIKVNPTEDRIQYYFDLYPFTKFRFINLIEYICKNFYDAIRENIDCGYAVQHIEKYLK